MKNFKQIGDTVSLVAPDETDGDVASGEGVLNGSLFGVAVVDIAAGESGPAKVLGVFELPKTTGQSWSVGTKLYWDAVTKKVTSTASSNKAIGAAVAEAGSGATTGLVRLNGAAVN